MLYHFIRLYELPGMRQRISNFATLWPIFLIAHRFEMAVFIILFKVVRDIIVHELITFLSFFFVAFFDILSFECFLWSLDVYQGNSGFTILNSNQFIIINEHAVIAALVMPMGVGVGDQDFEKDFARDVVINVQEAVYYHSDEIFARLWRAGEAIYFFKGPFKINLGKVLELIYASKSNWFDYNLFNWRQVSDRT